MDKICPYCQSQHLIKNGSAYGVPKWKCKDCLRQTSFKPPRGEPLWKKETAVLLYTLSMNAIAKQLGVSTPSILNWIRAHAATHAPRPQPEPGESVVVMELDELWHFLQKNPPRGLDPRPAIRERSPLFAKAIFPLSSKGDTTAESNT